MLKRVLTEIARGNQTDVTQLAQRLGISDALVRQMLQTLERMGYLRPISPACAPPCKYCPLRSRCSTLWELTPKGRQVAKDEL